MNGVSPSSAVPGLSAGHVESPGAGRNSPHGAASNVTSGLHSVSAAGEDIAHPQCAPTEKGASWPARGAEVRERASLGKRRE